MLCGQNSQQKRIVWSYEFKRNNISVMIMNHIVVITTWISFFSYRRLGVYGKKNFIGRGTTQCVMGEVWYSSYLTTIQVLTSNVAYLNLAKAISIAYPSHIIIKSLNAWASQGYSPWLVLSTFTFLYLKNCQSNSFQYCRGFQYYRGFQYCIFLEGFQEIQIILLS